MRHWLSSLCFVFICEFVFLSLFCLKKCNFLSKIFKSVHNINRQNDRRSFLYVSLRIWTGTDINKPQPRLKCQWDVSIGLIIQTRRISKKNWFLILFGKMYMYTCSKSLHSSPFIPMSVATFNVSKLSSQQTFKQRPDQSIITWCLRNPAHKHVNVIDMAVNHREGKIKYCHDAWYMYM